MLKVKRKGSLLVRRKSANETGESVGETYVTVAVRNPAEPERVWEGEFLVDTGAVDSLVPRQHLESIGIVPQGQRVYALAGGEEVRLDIAGARIELMGEMAGGTVVFGAENDEPILGSTVLESTGYRIERHKG